ncbi:MAG: hypothetical protein J3K34DRAFT_243383 [Monoraphidium minutum]|nr:MAG: hypothetical protein J3K34DRAFT_243383 [Monoraphidium minutum]
MYAWPAAPLRAPCVALTATPGRPTRPHCSVAPQRPPSKLARELLRRALVAGLAPAHLAGRPAAARRAPLHPCPQARARFPAFLQPRSPTRPPIRVPCMARNEKEVVTVQSGQILCMQRRGVWRVAGATFLPCVVAGAGHTATVTAGGTRNPCACGVCGQLYAHEQHGVRPSVGALAPPPCWEAARQPCGRSTALSRSIRSAGWAKAYIARANRRHTTQLLYVPSTRSTVQEGECDLTCCCATTRRQAVSVDSRSQIPCLCTWASRRPLPRPQRHTWRLPNDSGEPRWGRSGGAASQPGDPERADT